MNYIIIGLGNFGTSLGMALYNMGHDVMGIDKNQDIVEEYKDKMTQTVCLNSVLKPALASVSVSEADAVIVAIGEDWAASIQTAALLKELKAKRIIGRSLSDLHKMVLGGLGITEIINPELSAAEVLANHIISQSVVHTFNITPEVSIDEIEIPNSIADQSIGELDFERRFGIKIVAIKHGEVQPSIVPVVGKEHTNWTVLLDFDNTYRFSRGDHMVVCGGKSQIVKMLKVISKG